MLDGILNNKAVLYGGGAIAALIAVVVIVRLRGSSDASAPDQPSVGSEYVPQGAFFGMPSGNVLPGGGDGGVAALAASLQKQADYDYDIAKTRIGSTERLTLASYDTDRVLAGINADVFTTSALLGYSLDYSKQAGLKKDAVTGTSVNLSRGSDGSYSLVSGREFASGKGQIYSPVGQQAGVAAVQSPIYAPGAASGYDEPQSSGYSKPYASSPYGSRAILQSEFQ